MKKRIWELDVLRGIFLIGMIAVHVTYDLVELYRVITLDHSFLYTIGTTYGGVPFLLLSGVCVSFSKHPVRRGLTVFLGGLVVTAATAFLYLFHFMCKGILIYFGILHCLGICMMLWPLLRKLPVSVQAVLSIGILILGFYLDNNLRVDFPWLVPLGIIPRGFSSSDYFPLLPNLGYFLAGVVVGQWLYPTPRSLLPQVNSELLIFRFLSFLGRHSLLIYLLHQPIIAGILALLL